MFPSKSRHNINLKWFLSNVKSQATFAPLVDQIQTKYVRRIHASHDFENKPPPSLGILR